MARPLPRTPVSDYVKSSARACHLTRERKRGSVSDARQRASTDTPASHKPTDARTPCVLDSVGLAASRIPGNAQRGASHVRGIPDYVDIDLHGVATCDSRIPRERSCLYCYSVNRVFDSRCTRRHAILIEMHIRSSMNSNRYYPTNRVAMRVTDYE
jgi:hypothetical protein